MAEFSVTAFLDQASLNSIHGFNNYQSVLEPALLNAMETGISVIQASATDYMYAHFIDPTGATEDAWEVEANGPYESILTNTSPQGQRLEYGFSGMTDALGRFYPYWPAYHWAEQTVTQSRFKVAQFFQAAIDYANVQLGRGTP